MRTKPWVGLTGTELHAAAMTAARDGDREAMVVLVNELTPLLWHVARSHGLTRHDSEDVVQEVWLALFSHLNRLHEPRALAGWLITTTRRAAIREIRRSKEPVPLSDELAENLASDYPEPEAEILRAERYVTVRRAFGQLSARSRKLLGRLFVDEAPHAAVAHEMSLARGSIGPLRTRALRQLREQIAGESG